MEGWRVRWFFGHPNCRHLALPSPAPSRRLAVRRADPTRPKYVLVSDSTGYCNVNFKVVYVCCHQPETKSAWGPGDEPLMKC